MPQLPVAAGSQQAEKDFFNSWIAKEGDFNPFTQQGWDVVRFTFGSLVSPSGSLALLDVGAGTGRSRQIYADVSGRYVGIDIAEEAVATAKKRYPQDEWLVADACDLALADQTFDVVAFSSVLHHIPQFERAVKEAVRVLKPGGRVFAFDPNVLHPAMALFRLPTSPFYSARGVSPNERPMNPGVLRRAFLDAGLVDVRQVCKSGIGYRDVAPRFAKQGLAVFNAMDNLWEISGLGRWFGTFVFTCGAKPAADWRRKPR